MFIIQLGQGVDLCVGLTLLKATHLLDVHYTVFMLGSRPFLCKHAKNMAQ